MNRSTAAFAVCLLSAACSSVDREPVAPPGGPAPGGAAARRAIPDHPAAGQDANGVPAEAVSAALRRALEEGWRELRILNECGSDAGPATVEVFGNGVAIAESRLQFHLSTAEIRRLLEAFEAAGFAEMAETYGGMKRLDPDTPWPQIRPSPPPSETDSGPRVICRVVLELDGVSKQVAQLERGEQSEALRRLAETISEICRQPARSGISAGDLSDGLEKVAAGELAPETAAIVAHRKPQQGEGWLLQIDGLRASARRFVAGEGYGVEVVLELSQNELAELARRMRGEGLEDLPINLYAESYTDLKVEILNRRKSIQARRFAGMTPTEHGVEQERFDRIYETVRELCRRVLREGQARER